MIRDTLDPDSAQAMMIVSAARGVAFQRRAAQGMDTIGTTEAGPSAPYWVKIERDIGGMMTASHSADGNTWIPIGGEMITMNVPVYIGLAVTSHEAAATCEAVFSNVNVTGSASAQWSSRDIGLLNNAPEPMYVALANSTGPAAAVYHDNPNAAQTDVWTEWIIPLTDFADQGIDLTAVDKISLGFGDPGNVQAGGSGLVFFDSIRLY